MMTASGINQARAESTRPERKNDTDWGSDFFLFFRADDTTQL